MNDAEWDTLVLMIEQGFASQEPFDDRAANTYRVMLDTYTAEQVAGAIRKLLRTAKWRPSVAEIVQAIEGQGDDWPGWTEAWPAIQQAMRRYVGSKSDKSLAAARAMLEGVHPALAAFVEMEGWKSLTKMPVEENEFAALEIDRLGKRWADYAARIKERMAGGQSLADACAAGRLRSGNGLGQLDPAAVVKSMKPPVRGELDAGS